MSRLHRLIVTLATVAVIGGLAASAASAATVGTTFPAGFPTIVDASHGVTLSSGAFFTEHADLLSVWNRKALAALIAGL